MPIPSQQLARARSGTRLYKIGIPFAFLSAISTTVINNSRHAIFLPTQQVKACYQSKSKDNFYFWSQLTFRP